MEKQIDVKPISYGLTGFKVEDLLAKDFMAKLKKEMPTSIIAHFCIGFSDSKNIVAVSHEMIEGKFDLERVYVEGEGANSEQKVNCVVEILKKVLT
jgi:hypothetical protein